MRRESGVPTACQRGLFLHPWKNTVKGLAVHRPGRAAAAAAAAFHSLTKTISAGPLRYVHCLPPPSYSSSGPLPVFTRAAPLFSFRRVFPSFLRGWLFSALVRFRCPPVQSTAPPMLLALKWQFPVCIMVPGRARHRSVCPAATTPPPLRSHPPPTPRPQNMLSIRHAARG